MWEVNLGLAGFIQLFKFVVGIYYAESPLSVRMLR